MDIVTVFCEIDDFCIGFEPMFKQKLIAAKIKQRNRSMKIRLSEVMTIIVYFHSSGLSEYSRLVIWNVCGKH